MPTIETLFVGTCKDHCLLVVVSPLLHILILLLPFSVMVSGCCHCFFPRYYSPTFQQSMKTRQDIYVKKTPKVAMLASCWPCRADTLGRHEEMSSKLTFWRHQKCWHFQLRSCRNSKQDGIHHIITFLCVPVILLRHVWILSVNMVLCQLKRQHVVWCSRRCWKDLRLAEDLHLCDSVAHGAFPPFFNPPPPIFPIILRNRNKEWVKWHFVSGKAPIGLFTYNDSSYHYYTSSLGSESLSLNSE